MLNISQRPAKIGNQIRSNGEMHGEDTVTAFYIPIKGVMLTKEEVNGLAEDNTWWSRRFDERAGAPAEVLDAKNFDIGEKFKHRLEGAKVTFVHSLANEEIVFTACKVTKIYLEPKVGGLTEMSCEVQTVPTLDERAARLLGQLNHELTIQIEAAEVDPKSRQQGLPLDNPEDGDSEGGGE